MGIRRNPIRSTRAVVVLTSSSFTAAKHPPIQQLQQPQQLQHPRNKTKHSSKPLQSMTMKMQKISSTKRKKTITKKKSSAKKQSYTIEDAIQFVMIKGLTIPEALRATCHVCSSTYLYKLVAKRKKQFSITCIDTKQPILIPSNHLESQDERSALSTLTSSYEE